MPQLFAFAPAVTEKAVAAYYINVSPRKFEQVPQMGHLPKRRRVIKPQVSQMRHLDAFVAALPEWEAK